MEFLCSHILKMFHWIACTLTLHLHFLFIFLCCANGAMTKNRHVIVDMLLFLAHTWFAWSLVFVGMVNSNSSTTHLPPLHGDEEQESRTTLFKGRGDDVVQPTLSNPTYPKSPWTSKVNSFHYVIHYMSPLDVILLDHYPCVLLVMTVTSPREDGQDARGMESDKTVAWKRRRKRSRSFCSGTTAES